MILFDFFFTQYNRNIKNNNICKNNTFERCNIVSTITKVKREKVYEVNKLDDMYSLQRGDHYLPEYMVR